MLQSKLLIALRSFSAEELKRFDVFLRSPYFNQSDKLVNFFKLIEIHYPLFDSPKLEKEKLYKALHGKTVYKDQTMRELISELFKLLKTFLAHQELNKDALTTSELRFKWLFANSIPKLLDEELAGRRLMIEGMEQHDTGYYHHSWIYDLHNLEITANRFRGSEQKLFKELDIYAHINSLNRDFLVNCFSMHSYLIALSRIYQFPLDEAMLQQVENMALPYVNKGDHVFDIHFNIFQLARTYKEEYFFKLKANFFENSNSIPYDLMVQAGIGLANYCAKKIREGEEQFASEVMEVYKFEVKTNRHVDKGKMSYVYYFNVAARGVETNDLDWTENFIEIHKKNLPDDYREDAYRYAKAQILFGREKYNEALIMALSCNITFFVTKILVRNLVARIQYELDMFDELNTELDTHRHHLKDERLTAERKEYLNTFISMMRQLGELKRSYNKKVWNALSEEVELQKGFANRNWFKKKLKELYEIKGRSKK